jgi:DNA-binding CsgD family transcriptional regulator
MKSVENDFQKAIKSAVQISLEMQKQIDAFHMGIPKEMIHHFSPSMLFVTDEKHQAFRYVSPASSQITGYSPDQFYKGGYAFLDSLMHPADRRFVNRELADKFLDFVKSLSDAAIKKHRFTVTYRIKRSDGQYIQIFYQFSIYLRDKARNPLILVGSIQDVTPLRRDNTMRLQILKSHYAKGKLKYVETIIEQAISTPLTKREMEILKAISTGSTSHDIAHKMHLSTYTIKAHRRNILRKLGLSKFESAIQTAHNNGWLTTEK